MLAMASPTRRRFTGWRGRTSEVWDALGVLARQAPCVVARRSPTSGPRKRGPFFVGTPREPPFATVAKGVTGRL
jgi:hypothetical protein